MSIQTVGGLNSERVTIVMPPWGVNHAVLENTGVMSILLLQGVQLDFILDLHADISHEGVFVRGNSYDDVFRSVVNV